MNSRVPIAFDRFELDPGRRELRCEGQIVPVEPQVLDLIDFLASRPGQIVSKDDLVQEVWGGRVISDSAISSRINAARAALGDDGTRQHLIRTIHGRGFRLEAEICPVAAPAPGLTGKPSVAVLPFENLSGDPEQRYFSDGITDDIITDLSRYAEIFVIARHSSFAYRNSDKGLSEIAREMGVQYVTLGSVRRAGDRIRVSARLVKPDAGNEIWAERFDRRLTDIFDVQDEIGAVIVNTLAGQITRQHSRSLSKSPELMTAYDHVLRALDLTLRVGPEETRAARIEAERALESLPGFARAHAITAWCHVNEGTNAWSGAAGDAFDLARAAALAAVSADDTEPMGHTALGWVYLWSDHAHDHALEALSRAVSLHPGSAYYRSYRSFALAYAGQSELALSELNAAIRLNPHYPVLYDNFYGRALFNLGRYEEAIPRLQRVRVGMPGNANALALVASCYAALDRREEACATIGEIGAISQDYTLGFAAHTVPYRRDDERQQFLQLLRRAGLED